MPTTTATGTRPRRRTGPPRRGRDGADTTRLPAPPPAGASAAPAGRDQPTVIITSDQQATTRNLIGQYTRRMTIEQRLAEIIRAFCADALSSTANLYADLDVMLAVLS